MEESPNKKCPVEYALAQISGKWRIMILKELSQGPVRYGAIDRSIKGISAKVLVQHLREMEEDGLVIRTIYPEVPPRVEYSLTELGRSLQPIHDAMWKWGEEYKAKLRDA